jgi:hypothetical protein
MDIEKLQQTINREAWQRYRAAQAGTAGTPASRQVAAFIASYTAKRPHAASLVPSPAEPGPQEIKAKQLCAAIAVAKAKVKSGDIAEASSVWDRDGYFRVTLPAGGA